MDSPIRPPFPIFPRAIDRIDDPDTRFSQPFCGVLAFFGKQAVVGPLLAQGSDKESVGSLVPRFAKSFALELAAFA